MACVGAVGAGVVAGFGIGIPNLVVGAFKGGTIDGVVVEGTEVVGVVNPLNVVGFALLSETCSTEGFKVGEGVGMAMGEAGPCDLSPLRTIQSGVHPGDSGTQIMILYPHSGRST